MLGRLTLGPAVGRPVGTPVTNAFSIGGGDGIRTHDFFDATEAL